MPEGSLKTQDQRRPPPTPTQPCASQILPDPFVFVPITTAEAARGRGSAKRIVRAHVTRLQHAKSSKLSSTQHLQSWTVKPQPHKPQAAQAHTANPPLVRTSSSPRSALSSTETSSEDGSENTSATSITSISPELVLTVPKIPAGRRNGADRQDPFWSYPVEYQPYLPAIFAHYIEHLAVDIPDLDGPAQKGLLRRVWFPLAMEEEATMYAVLLMAASHYNAVVPNSIKTKDLVFLKSKAINAINSGLRDPQRATSDAMVGAVMKIAAYEAVFGDSTVFSTHMKGLSTMLNMRGGLSTLGLDGLLERMVVWIDLNAAFVCGMVKQFGNESFPTVVTFEKADPYHFAGIQ